MRLLTAPFVEAWWDRLINIHPSLLPAFRGLHTHERVLAYGARFSGCTVHFVRPAMDDGPIIVQAAVPVLDDDDADGLAARILVQEHRIYPLAVRLIAEGRVRVEGTRVRVDGAAAPEAALVNPTGLSPPRRRAPPSSRLKPPSPARRGRTRRGASPTRGRGQVGRKASTHPRCARSPPLSHGATRARASGAATPSPVRGRAVGEGRGEGLSSFCFRRRALAPRRDRPSSRSGLPQPTISMSLKKKPISFTAFSGESEPWTAFSCTFWPKAARTVPGSALAGLVAPMISRFLVIALSPSRTCTTTGPGAHVLDELAVERPLGVDRVELLRHLLAQPQPLLRHDLEAAVLEHRDDLAGDVARRRVRLDDGQSAFSGHGQVPFFSIRLIWNCPSVRPKDARFTRTDGRGPAATGRPYRPGAGSRASATPARAVRAPAALPGIAPAASRPSAAASRRGCPCGSGA